MKKLFSVTDESGKLSLKMKILIVVAIVVAFFLGRIGDRSRGTHDHSAHAIETKDSKGETVWTCSMHPQIKLPKPGKCPICFMDLIPLEKGSNDEESERQLSFSEAAKKLADIEVAPVERKNAYAEIRMVGKVSYDESRVKKITARMAGRLDRLFVDYTGVKVRKGDHLFEIYSPALFSAQEEFLQAHRSADAAFKRAAREKLLLWGLTKRQLEKIQRRGKALSNLTIYSPLSGIVIQKHGIEGAYVGTGTPIYTIADLSKVWLKLDAYETDLSWLRYGQEVEFTATALPGEILEGRISFIDPVLNPKTRTVKVRVNVGNMKGRLKPEMFVTGIVKAQFSSSGEVIDKSLAGKWIGLMHPEIIKSRPGKCDICGMALVRAETLGFAKKGNEVEEPLVIPASSPLITGKRSVVYVKVPGKDKPTYEGREIVLGPRAGDYYVVRSGLVEGEEVVFKGAFKIDSELQIQARPSMMNPIEESEERKAEAKKKTKPRAKKRLSAKVPSKFLKSLDSFYKAYFSAQMALANDDLAKAKSGLAGLQKSLTKVRDGLLKGEAKESWGTSRDKIKSKLVHLPHFKDIGSVREAFGEVSSAMIEIQKNFGHVGKTKHFVAFCPMAFNDKGGSWLQTNETISNPFYGADMLRCGEIKEKFGGK